MPQVYTIKRVLELPAAHVYRVVGDVVRYPEFVPYCRGCTVETQHEGRPHNVQLRVGWDALEERFLSQVTYGPESVVAHAANNKMFKELHCAWTVKPVTPKQCLAELLLRFQLQNRVYDALTQRLGPSISRQMIKAFSERAYALAGQ